MPVKRLVKYFVKLCLVLGQILLIPKKAFIAVVDMALAKTLVPSVVLDQTLLVQIVTVLKHFAYSVKKTEIFVRNLLFLTQFWVLRFEQTFEFVARKLRLIM